MKGKAKSETVNPVFSILAGIICFILLTLFDQLTKRWAVLHLAGKDPVILIQNVFQLRYLENRGAAFGIMQGRSILFYIITIAVLVLLVIVYVRTPYIKRYRFLRILLVFIAAGAVGNFIDRVSQHYVVDFFYFNLIDFPIFNVADSYVTVCVIILIIYLIFGLKEDDLSEILKGFRFGRKNGKEEKDS